jgi:hypothetical protein
MFLNMFIVLLFMLLFAFVLCLWLMVEISSENDFTKKDSQYNKASRVLTVSIVPLRVPP